MNIVLKNSLKNIFGKPLRTLLVVFAIFVCSFCALLCFDLSESITGILTLFYGSVSRADFIVSSSGSDVSTLPEGFPEADTMTIVGDSEMLYKKIDGEYCYVTTDTLRIMGLDVDEAVDMKFLAPIDLKDDEVFINKAFSDDYGYKVGDKITIHDRADEELEFTIGGILPDDTKNPLITGYTAIMNLNSSKKVSCGRMSADMLLIDLHDNTLLEEAKDMIEDRYPAAVITELYLSESDLALVNEMKSVFYLLFAIAFLLVIFVTASICNRIVSERMSYIGTLRSLGMSTSRTGRILLLENVLYALLGSIPATLLYAAIRNPLLSVMFNGKDSEGNAVQFDIPAFPVGLVIGVILGSVLIECLIPLRAILKALKTSIRDIIFDNRDTAYRFSKATLVIGIICLVTSVVTFFFRTNMILAILCMLTSVAALAALFPWILKFITALIKKISDKLGRPSMALASVEAISRKSTVGSGVLCATAAAMCVIVYAVSGAMSDNINDIPYDCDVILTASEKDTYYSFIDHMDNVTDTEMVYMSMTEYKLSDEKVSIGNFFAMPDDGFRYFKGFSDLPEKVEQGTIVLDKKYANRKGLKEGDTITLTFNPEGVVPIDRKFTVAKITSFSASTGMDTFLMNEDEYKVLCYGSPAWILIKTSDPEGTKAALETYAKGAYSKVETISEYIADQKQQNSKQLAIIGAIIIIALGMTAIGMISNQLLGFEGRKKECAVMLSTAMGKGKLSGILFKEVLITSVTASGIGTLVGLLMINVIEKAMASTQSISMSFDVNPLTVFLFFIAMTVVFTGTVLFPIRNLRKMKISEQIKYE
ncbi:MAG: FtsX-like permease family protein [Saccharofermentans sp.]|nr:FtsX-like permease family protein [Saccharofermentans sp.]